MPLAPYQGSVLVPGMGAPTYSAEHDLMGLIYGSPHLAVYLTYAVVDGSSRDSGNTQDPTVLRPGLVMAQVTATKKWKPFDPAGMDGTEVPRGILTFFGLNTQMDGSDTDRFLATILIGGWVNPEAVCLANTSSYGLPQTGDGLTVRKAFKYSIHFSDDPHALLPEPMASR